MHRSQTSNAARADFRSQTSNAPKPESDLECTGFGLRKRLSQTSNALVFTVETSYKSEI